ncbi:hypothetical protein PGTUg99_035193 [Puccinia graminis f. sp. tritici]|uniref:Uncharacterized protein n=1 Tax=Puccinia graminis f. sp. tritici TaxID=56615 RepID=A0A5B0PQ28_PUCGR|nr:hypothetical protein PGTUg99_035193 [Puccinia graminis f. sp. tritici]
MCVWVNWSCQWVDLFDRDVYALKSSFVKSMNLPRSDKIRVVRAENQWPDGGKNFLIAALDVSFFAA